MVERRRVAIEFKKPSKTKQSFKDECNINKILDRYKKTGTWSSSFGVALRKPITGDFTNVPDSYHEALNIVDIANNAFMSLPSSVRDRFQNDPAQLMAFISDDKNYDEALKLGLVEPKPVVQQPSVTTPVDTTSNGGAEPPK